LTVGEDRENWNVLSSSTPATAKNNPVLRKMRGSA
jgi:hypothetical protein